MPHYKDGTLAELGDTVKGKPYNTDREVTGTVIDINVGKSCNLVIAWVESGVPVGKEGIHVPTWGRSAVCEVQSDFGETQAFEKIQ